MILRTTIPADLDKLVSIHQETIGSSWDKKDFLSAVERKNNKIVFTMLVEEEIVGYIMVGILSPEAEIINIAVTVNKQQTGLGSCAIDLLVKEMLKEEVEIIFLEVREKSRAVNFYCKNGFEVIGLRKKYYPDGENALLMQRKLRM